MENIQKRELLDLLKREHENLFTVANTIQEKGLENEIVDKKWVLKDVISHIMLYEREAVKVLKKGSIENNNFYSRTDDDRNEENFQKTHSKSLEEILADAHEIYKGLLLETEKLGPIELDSIWPGMKRPVKLFIIGESIGHYDDHIPKIQKRFNI